MCGSTVAMPRRKSVVGADAGVRRCYLFERGVSCGWRRLDVVKCADCVSCAECGDQVDPEAFTAKLLEVYVDKVSTAPACAFAGGIGGFKRKC